MKRKKGNSVKKMIVALMVAGLIAPSAAGAHQSPSLSITNDKVTHFCCKDNALVAGDFTLHTTSKRPVKVKCVVIISNESGRLGSATERVTVRKPVRVGWGITYNPNITGPATGYAIKHCHEVR